jgi:histidine triad (HIT) family protein
METDCLFCQIASDKSKLVWENANMAAFKDIHPKAPVHILVVPKRHVESLDQLDDRDLAAELINGIKQVASQAGIAGGYRVQINVGRHGGQLVDHLHIHLLGGKTFGDEAA